MDRTMQGQYLWLLFAERTFSYERSVRMILGEVPIGEYPRLLEIGCGTGTMLALLEREGYLCTGVDIDSTRIHLARLLNDRCGGRCEFVDLPANRYHASQQFDAAVWMNVPLSIEALVGEFLPCIERNVRPGGRVLFDYLTSHNSVRRPGGSEEWVDELEFAGNDLLPEGLYRRTVTMDFSEHPCSVRWLGDSLIGGHVERMFDYRTSLPTLERHRLRDAYSERGWRHVAECLAEPIKIDGKATRLMFVIDIFDRRAER